MSLKIHSKIKLFPHFYIFLYVFFLFPYKDTFSATKLKFQNLVVLCE